MGPNTHVEDTLLHTMYFNIIENLTHSFIENCLLQWQVHHLTGQCAQPYCFSYMEVISGI